MEQYLITIAISAVVSWLVCQVSCRTACKSATVGCCQNEEARKSPSV